jgi:acylphosphatase
MEARTRVVITGRVQGVGFRAWAVQQARTLGLRGWIRNRADGAVEAEMAGDPDAVARMRDLLAQGPPLARVERLVESLPDTFQTVW